MNSVSSRNFGYLIAYLLPGFVVLVGLSQFSEVVRSWLLSSSANAPTVGGFLYVTLASVALGMTVSAVRWLVLDKLHHLLGVSPPKWDFAKLPQSRTAFETVVEYHYRYYQFYGNMLIALAALGALAPNVLSRTELPIPIVIVVYGAAIILFFLASRDALCKYYARANGLLGRSDRPVREIGK